MKNSSQLSSPNFDTMPPKKTQSGFHSNYSTGIRAENSIANQYRNNGWNVSQSAGSRGAADLKCTKGEKTHFVQVKSSTVNSNPSISNQDLGRLKSTATRNHATSVVAFVAADKSTSVQYAKTGSAVKI